MTSNWSVDLKLELVNKKLDKILELLENVNLKKKKPEQSKETDWSIEEYNGNILIRFSFNTEFKNFIKSLGGKWMVSKTAWVFKNDPSKDIFEKFPLWTFKE